MGKYIGEDTPYGVFQRQKIEVFVNIDTYTLQHRISNESSIIVICDRLILQPITDYTVFRDGTVQKIKFSIDFEELENKDTTIGNIELHILYLGKELLNSSVPSISNVQDVVINNPLPGQVLKYTENGGWINADAFDGTTLA